MNLIKWFRTPQSPDISEENFVNVQIDAVGVGLGNAAAQMLSVFLTRLGASSLEVGLLTTMPGVTGLFFAILIGRFLQRQKNIVRWFSSSRLLVIGSYGLTGLVPFIFKDTQAAVIAILCIWAVATLPQTVLAISFSVVMNAVAGPAGRYELMTRRWSLLGLTSSLVALAIGQVLVSIKFPLNFQTVFLTTSIGSIISYTFSSRIRIADIQVDAPLPGPNLKEKIHSYYKQITANRPFVSFVFKRFVYLTGANLGLPLFPLYFVRQINASDGWIAAINTAQTAILIIGYFFWTRQSRRRGSRFVLLLTTFGLASYPILTAFTQTPALIVVYAGIAGIFQAGINLVFFDELLKTIPPEYSATFVSVAQSLEYCAAIAAPLLASLLAETIGLPGALLVSGSLRLLGASLFLLDRPGQQPVTQ